MHREEQDPFESTYSIDGAADADGTVTIRISRAPAPHSGVLVTA
jgi:hypothetical protein